ncbi:hypothetical protein MGMO_45c00060 [Methyloglobulus morosus KoM1]|uniref:Uncharacterized protein n=1 Tax=Methyloglobulus morosus KoM1 TaxID=1116472 RepID=V5BY56_9GAMM|nr:hypothetical protein [Methyloglobulus morosus]ESS72774.1 hypothetical protein MGMO_45c00060 [Methyloglobulus morosus KoM1]
MKLTKKLMLIAMFSLLVTGQVWAAASITGCIASGGQANGCSPAAAPEMDAANATIPVALMTGIVLLLKERSRSKRPSKSGQ